MKRSFVEDNYQEEPLDLSLRKSINSDKPDNPEERIDLSQSIDTDQSIDPMNAESFVHFEIPSRGKLAKFIRSYTSKFELSPTVVECKIRELQNYIENCRCSNGTLLNARYVKEILPNILALWTFNNVILIDEYYQELVKTVMFLAEAIGSNNMIEVVVVNLIGIDEFFPFGDQAKVLKKQCHKMAIETMGKMVLMSHFDPTRVSQYMKRVLTKIIWKYLHDAIHDPVMLFGMNTIVSKMEIRE